MATGDSFAFDSSLPHKFRNPSDEEAEVIWAITPPSF
ncbi:MAG: cupin domain-containing protein [Pseudomonadota bacterium]